MAAIGRYLATQGRIEEEVARRPNPKVFTREEARLSEELRAIQLDFGLIFTKLAMDYAERKRLNLRIRDAFGDGDYLYIEKKRWHRRDVGYELMKKVVATQSRHHQVDEHRAPLDYW